MTVLLLLLTIVTGLFGTPQFIREFQHAVFLIAFALGFTYLTAIVGDLYAVVNPWRVLCDWTERVRSSTLSPRVPYPVQLAYWPAARALLRLYLDRAIRAHATALGRGHSDRLYREYRDRCVDFR